MFGVAGVTEHYNETHSPQTFLFQNNNSCFLKVQVQLQTVTWFPWTSIESIPGKDAFLGGNKIESFPEKQINDSESPEYEGGPIGT